LSAHCAADVRAIFVCDKYVSCETLIVTFVLITTDVGLMTTVQPETTTAAAQVSDNSTVIIATVTVAVAVIAFVVVVILCLPSTAKIKKKGQGDYSAHKSSIISR